MQDSTDGGTDGVADRMADNVGDATVELAGEALQRGVQPLQAVPQGQGDAGQAGRGSTHHRLLVS